MSRRQCWSWSRHRKAFLVSFFPSLSLSLISFPLHSPWKCPKWCQLASDRMSSAIALFDRQENGVQGQTATAVASTIKKEINSLGAVDSLKNQMSGNYWLLSVVILILLCPSAHQADWQQQYIFFRSTLELIKKKTNILTSAANDVAVCSR